jgi:putative addiction module component (TIGR02574 family)
MPTIDFSHLSQQERLDLIEALWDSLDAEAVTLTEAQAREIDGRIAMLDANPQDGRDAFEALTDLRRQLRRAR